MTFDRRHSQINAQEEAARRLAFATSWARANMRPDDDAASRIAQANVRRHTGEWIRSQATWSDFFTLTFAWHTDEGPASRMLWDWLKQITRHVIREHVTVAYAIERAPGRYGRVHVHGLLAISRDVRVRREDLRVEWRRLHRATGFDRWLRYTDGRGGPWYVVKANAEWDLGVACPRRFARCRPHCAEDPTPR